MIIFEKSNPTLTFTKMVIFWLILILIFICKFKLHSFYSCHISTSLPIPLTLLPCMFHNNHHLHIMVYAQQCVAATCLQVCHIMHDIIANDASPPGFFSFLNFILFYLGLTITSTTSTTTTISINIAGLRLETDGS